jgi:surface protein
MKIKTLFGAGLVLTSLLASCSSEDLLQGNQNAGTNTLTAYIESQNDSRVSISDEGKFTWSADDKISVASTSSSFETWSLSKINDDGSADFAVPDATTTANEGVYAVFPETLNPTVSDDGTLQITLPAEYESNKTVPILTGKYNDGKVDFAHAGGLIRVSFENIPSSATKFVFSTNNQNITGSFTIDDNNAINTSEDENNTVTINIADGDNVDGNMTFDIPVPVGEYSGFTISIYCGDDLFISQSTSEGNTYTIERRDLLVMPTISFSNYVIETVTPYSTDEKTNILGYSPGNGIFDISQVAAIYIDGVAQSEVTYSYLFSDTENHTIIIAMKDNFNDASGMFAECKYVTSFDFSNFDTSNVTDMSCMFIMCSALKSLDLSNFKTNNVEDMSTMFYRCEVLSKLDLSNFVTAKVTIMGFMFGFCNGLKSVDVSNFDTRNVTDMRNMFWECHCITSLDLSSFDTRNVTNMKQIFEGCHSLSSLDLSNFDTSNVTDMCEMFSACTNLTSLDLSKFDTSKVTDMSRMFDSCSALPSIDLSKFDTSSVTTMEEMFYKCTNLSEIKMIGAISNVKSYDRMFTNVPASGTFYYPSDYKSDYESKIFSQSELDGWTKIAQ